MLFEANLKMVLFASLQEGQQTNTDRQLTMLSPVVIRSTNSKTIEKEKKRRKPLNAYQNSMWTTKVPQSLHVYQKTIYDFT